MPREEGLVTRQTGPVEHFDYVKLIPFLSPVVYFRLGIMLCVIVRCNFLRRGINSLLCLYLAVLDAPIYAYIQYECIVLIALESRY